MPDEHHAPRLVAIHQPNFFPWLGFFHKLHAADVFILLDDAQCQKTGGSWTNRVQLARGGTPFWWSAPVERHYHGTRTVREMRFAPAAAWREALLRVLREAYRSAPYRNDVFAWLTPLFDAPVMSVSDFNRAGILAIANALELRTDHVVLASSLAVPCTGTARLVTLVQSVAGTAYLTGTGSSGYLEPADFTAARLALHTQQFACRPYPQGVRGAFVAGLSALDALLWCGPEETRALIDRSSCEDAVAAHAV